MDPKSLRYAKSHEWAVLNGDVCTVGLSQFAVEQLTDIIYIELPKVGKRYQTEESIGSVESVKSVNDIYAPVGGEVIEANKAVETDPSLVSADPLGKGWLIKVRVAPGTTLDHLMTLEAYQEQIATH